MWEFGRTKELFHILIVMLVIRQKIEELYTKRVHFTAWTSYLNF